VPEHVNDTVAIIPYTGSPIKVDGVEYLMLTEDDVYCVLEDVRVVEDVGGTKEMSTTVDTPR